MIKSLLIFLLILPILLPSGCQTIDSEGEANDYMPFTTGGYLYHWSKGDTIKIYLPKDSSADGYQGYYRDAFIEGLNRWAATLSEFNIRLDITDIKNGNDVHVIWSNDVPIGVLGLAALDTWQGVSRKIVMTTKLNYGSGIQSHSKKDITKIAAHEFGHILGIWSHSFDEADLMSPFLDSTEAPSNRDRETMKYLYSLSPDINLSNLPVNIPSTSPNLQGNSPRHMIRALCGPNRQEYDYKEFEFKVLKGTP